MDQTHQFSDQRCAEAEQAVCACVHVCVTSAFQDIASTRPDMTVPR
jgi:hypothetical protein